jgi:hypothetical protein
MAVISIKNKTKSGSLLNGNAPFIPTNYESIETVTGTGSSGTITFSSIPSTYQHLQLRYLGRNARGVTGDTLRMTFNSDSGSNYAYHASYGGGSTTESFGATSLAYAPVGYVAGASAAANIMGVGVVDILDYANTSKNKTFRSLHGEDFNGSGDMALFSGLWMSATAINSITIVGGTGANFTTTTHFALYGIKG